jgi:2',3'-cyclic-nucleotide 2'-phosphodiesterase / 3'-nucleotidase
MDGNSHRRRHPASVILLTLLLSMALVWPAGAQPTNERALANHTAELTLMGTADLHGYVLNWDYFNNQPFAPGRDGEPGLAKVATLVEEIRAERGEEHTLLLDTGDTIQGSMLAQYYAKVEPVTETGEAHPMALAMNAMGYDAMVVGNHEFNFGVPFLREFERQAAFPLLGANVRDATTGDEAFTPYTIETVNLKGHKPIRVGILGLTTPGSAIWDRDKVEGILTFEGGVETAEYYVPKMIAEGADLVVVLAHSGTQPGSSYGDASPNAENFASTLAEEVPGIDAIFAAHSHTAIPQRFITNAETGEQVLLSQPGSWGRNLSVMDFELRKVRGQWTVVEKSSELRNVTAVPEHPAIVSLVQTHHQKTLDYVNSVIGTSLAEMTMSMARFYDVPALDFVNHVQTEVVREGLVGTAYEDLPVLSIAAPFNRAARIPEGEVSVRDIAGIYIYDNTLIAVELTGAQLIEYLEYSAGFFGPVASAGPINAADVPTTKPDYNYDVISGIGYDIDLSQPYGSRIENVTFEGAALDPAARFVVALNNYRQNGGGGFPHVATAPIVYNPLTEIRERIIDWVKDTGVIDPADFASVDWKLVHGTTPIEVLP